MNTNTDNVEFKETKDWKVFTLPGVAVSIVLYLSFVAAGLYSAQEYFMLLPVMLPEVFPGGEMTGGFYLYFIAALVDFGIYELISYFFFNYMRGFIPQLNAKRLRHICRYFFVLRNLAYALFAVSYFFSPLFLNFGQTIVKFIFTAGACLLFFLYIKRDVPDYKRALLLRSTATPFFIYHLVFIAMYFLTGNAL